MLGSYARDFQVVVVLQFGNVAIGLCLVGSNGSQHEKFWGVLVVAEGGWFKNDFLEHLN